MRSSWKFTFGAISRPAGADTTHAGSVRARTDSTTQRRPGGADIRRSNGMCRRLRGFSIPGFRFRWLPPPAGVVSAPSGLRCAEQQRRRTENSPQTKELLAGNHCQSSRLDIETTTASLAPTTQQPPYSENPKLKPGMKTHAISIPKHTQNNDTTEHHLKSLNPTPNLDPVNLQFLPNETNRFSSTGRRQFVVVVGQ